MNPPVDKEAFAERLQKESDAFRNEATEAWTELFEAAKRKNELAFVQSLFGEFRGAAAAGWNSAQECFVALHDYVDFLNKMPSTDRLRIRVALAFYCHISEASGFYEVPKNLLRVAEGNHYIIVPFKDIVREHRVTGDAITPNASAVFKDLVGHSELLKFKKLTAVLKKAFDPDLRNAFAHADYVVWTDGIRLTRRNGGIPTLVSYQDFSLKLQRAVDFFNVLALVQKVFLKAYDPPKTILGRLGGGPEENWTISFDPTNGKIGIESKGVTSHVT
jgi:hypothetical protein